MKEIKNSNTACSITGCPGHYEDKKITHVVKHQDEIIVFENVAAKVCSICGDVLLPISTVETIEKMLVNPGKPVRTAPIYKIQDSPISG